MSSLRPVGVLSGGLVAVLALLLPRLALPGPAKDGEAAGLRLATEAKFKTYLDVVADAVKDGDWDAAARGLHAVLDIREDVFIRDQPPGAGGKAAEAWTGARAAARQRLRALPPQGLARYREKFGPAADKLLADAGGNPGRLAEVVRRFDETAAAAQALDRLGTRHLDAGRADLAAVCFTRRLQSPGAAVPLPTLYRAAVAFRSTGDKAQAEAVWKQLAARAGADGLRVGGRRLSLDEARRDLDRASPPVPSADWTMFRGDARRSGWTAGGAPLLQNVLWQRPTDVEKDEEDGKDDRKNGGPLAARGHINRALDRLKGPVVCGPCPLAVGDQLFFRTQARVSAVFLRDVKDRA